MARLEQRGKPFHSNFRIRERKFKKSLTTTSADEATLMANCIERRLALIEQGDLAIPPDVDLITFLRTDGKLERLVPKWTP